MPTSLPTLKFSESLTQMYDWVGGLIERQKNSASLKNPALLKVLLYSQSFIPEIWPTFVNNTVKYQMAYLSNKCSTGLVIDVDFLTYSEHIPQHSEACSVSLPFLCLMLLMPQGSQLDLNNSRKFVYSYKCTCVNTHIFSLTSPF